MLFRRAKRWKQRLGRAGESAAARMLLDKGFQILLRNCKTPRAELDLIVREGGTIVFVEVKTLYLRPDHHSRESLRPAGQLRMGQKRRICRGAASYLQELGAPDALHRFDLVEVIYNRWGPYMIRHWRDHFSAKQVFHRSPWRGRDWME